MNRVKNFKNSSDTALLDFRYTENHSATKIFVRISEIFQGNYYVKYLRVALFPYILINIVSI